MYPFSLLNPNQEIIIAKPGPKSICLKTNKNFVETNELFLRLQKIKQKFNFCHFLLLRNPNGESCSSTNVLFDFNQRDSINVITTLTNIKKNLVVCQDKYETNSDCRWEVFFLRNSKLNEKGTISIFPDFESCLQIFEQTLDNLELFGKNYQEISLYHCEKKEKNFEREIVLNLNFKISFKGDEEENAQDPYTFMNDRFEKAFIINKDQK